MSDNSTDAAVDAIATEVHALECNCPPGADHDTDLHQNQVWVTTVLAVAEHLGYRVVRESASTADAQPNGWSTRAPRSLTDLTCLQGHVIQESQDRRWLWRLTFDLGMRIEGSEQRQLRHDLDRYLWDTCAHHWHDRTTDEPETRWQCIWCHRVEDGPYPTAVPA